MNPMANELPLSVWIGTAILLLAQGTWLFLDARKKRRYPWFWGIWGLTGFPPLIVYFVVTWGAARRRKQR